MNLRFALRAETDLNGIFDYIATDNPAAAARVRKAILDSAQMIARRPYVGLQSGNSNL